MGQQVDIIGGLHKSTVRNYLQRMMDDKVHCMTVARRYGKDYWDGDRRYGYGGYRYDGRWAAVARELVERYALPPDAAILDVGCGKAHLLYELARMLPRARVVGLDCSVYALDHAKEEVRDQLRIHRAQDPLPFATDEFDLVLSITTIHNLEIFDVAKALREIDRVGKRKYIVVESYRNEPELFNLQCWALTCEAFLTPEAWFWLFERVGYTGDYEFIFFE